MPTSWSKRGSLRLPMAFSKLDTMIRAKAERTLEASGKPNRRECSSRSSSQRMRQLLQSRATTLTRDREAVYIKLAIRYPMSIQRPLTTATLTTSLYGLTALGRGSAICGVGANRK